MSTTVDRPQRVRLTREQAADRLLEMLSDEPVTETELRRQLLGKSTSGGSTDVVRNGLAVLEARHQAVRVPGTAGSRLGGWVRYIPDEGKAPPLHEIDFPYEWRIVPLSEMFIDQDYQRPLTNFVERIQARFNPVLFQTLAISDRGRNNKPHRYAIIDGQTRWVAASRLGVKEAPCIVFSKLTPADEANIFAQLQKERRGMVSWHRFRAELAAQKEEPLAIQKLAKSTGFVLGDGVGQLRAVSALESVFRQDPILLERSLVDFHTAWPELIPDGTQIRGMAYFFRHFPIGESRTREVDDTRLVDKLRAWGPDRLNRKMNANKEASASGKGSSAKFMGLAIQAAYQSR